MIKKSLVALSIFVFGSVTAQKSVTYTETTKKYITYPFSDPDPIPTNKIYPYYRFDGFTNKGIEKEWKVVLLENEYISVQIMPEIGGKVWSAQDKKSNKPFFYNNDVVKFRDIAMRGPWVSGGIEANYGIIGHTPNTSTPVDYLVRSNADGSVSCFTSTLDLLTRTRWILEIRLEKDKAYFTTRSFWFNSTGIEQPYYTWMNAGIPAGEDLKFLYPGNYYIGHDGKSHNWPIDDHGNDLSYYAQNDFGGSKSYHVLGAHSNYFGVLWEKEDFGMIHYAKREDKLGKKIFLWAQSPSGGVWEDLLTDNSGQYVEIQSGRLFNQNQFNSSFTPFKQIGFAPYVTDTWTEYWYPFSGIGGFSGANLLGAFNVKQESNSISVKISPVQDLNDSLYVYNSGGRKIASAYIHAKTLQPVETTVDLKNGEEASRIELKGFFLDLKMTNDGATLSRPVDITGDFKDNSAYALYLQGRDLANFRDYQLAETKIRESLSADSLLLPSLIEYGKLKLFRMQYDSAFDYLKKALSIDTYNGEANYYYGMAAAKSSRFYDALDGFEVATLTGEFRNAAYTALAHEHLKNGNLHKAEEYVFSALENSSGNLQALKLLTVIARTKGNKNQWQEAKEQIATLNPLDHFIRFETMMMSPAKENKDNFVHLIRNEMPVETFLELAIWYANMGRLEESRKVLELAPQNTETLYWLAWLYREEKGSLAKEYLEKAAASTPTLVFPFREETAKVLEWAAKEDAEAWQPDYFLALINDFRGNRQYALDKLQKHHQNINFAPFYVVQARLRDAGSITDKLSDINKAVSINPSEWRYLLIKANLLEQMNRDAEAIALIEKYYKANKHNYIAGLNLAKILVKNDSYEKADKVLAGLTVLPFEGATDARRYYRQTKLMLADASLKKGRLKEALTYINAAEEWPERLGVGKPYPALIEADLENWLKAEVYKKMKKQDVAESFLKKVKNKDINDESYLNLIRMISSREDERLF